MHSDCLGPYLALQRRQRALVLIYRAYLYQLTVRVLRSVV